MSAADGYARITHRPACVIVHVDVGTAALGQGLHNASSGRAPVVIFAGVAPSTLDGETPGSRTEHVQWYQDIRDQAALVAPYSRYSAEIKSALHVQTVVHRAVLMATTGSPGPVYLTATREILAQPVESIEARRRPNPSCQLGGLLPEAVGLISEALIEAKAPLVITGYLGRNHQAVRNLVNLANLVKGIRVFDSEIREVCFPADHPAWVTRGTGAAKAVQNADVILVLDADVPWIPAKVRPSPDAQIFHIDLDPRKEKMNIFDIGASATYLADSASVLAQLTDYISQSARVAGKDIYAERWASLQTTFEEGQQLVTSRALKALDTPDAASSVDFLLYTLRSTVPENTIFVSDSVTNQVFVSEQLRFTRLGSHMTKGGSGLGWAGGAAVGVKLATKLYDVSDRPSVRRRESTSPESDDPFVCMITGDGSFVFSVPTAVYWASHRHHCPFLTIILNNGGWRATRQCIVDVHPDGTAFGTTNEELGISLEADGPNYGEVAKAAANGNLWTKIVTRVADLEATLVEARSVVLEQKISAVVDVIIK
jgi:thiamine pyrophosphate-dependent acetolactate synthase large subunit-like protein